MESQRRPLPDEEEAQLVAQRIEDGLIAHSY